METKFKSGFGYLQFSSLESEVRRESAACVPTLKAALTDRLDKNCGRFRSGPRLLVLPGEMDFLCPEMSPFKGCSLLR